MIAILMTMGLDGRGIAKHTRMLAEFMNSKKMPFKIIAMKASKPWLNKDFQNIKNDFKNQLIEVDEYDYDAINKICEKNYVTDLIIQENLYYATSDEILKFNDFIKELSKYVILHYCIHNLPKQKVEKGKLMMLEMAHYCNTIFVHSLEGAYSDLISKFLPDGKSKLKPLNMFDTTIDNIDVEEVIKARTNVGEIDIAYIGAFAIQKYPFKLMGLFEEDAIDRGVITYHMHGIESNIACMGYIKKHKDNINWVNNKNGIDYNKVNLTGPYKTEDAINKFNYMFNFSGYYTDYKESRLEFVNIEQMKKGSILLVDIRNAENQTFILDGKKVKMSDFKDTFIFYSDTDYGEALSMMYEIAANKELHEKYIRNTIKFLKENFGTSAAFRFFINIADTELVSKNDFYDSILVDENFREKMKHQRYVERQAFMLEHKRLSNSILTLHDGNKIIREVK